MELLLIYSFEIEMMCHQWKGGLYLCYNY